MLPEQIVLHSHPGHDFNLDLEDSYSRSQFFPCAQPEGQGTLQKGSLKGTQKGCGGHLHCLHMPQLPSTAKHPAGLPQTSGKHSRTHTLPSPL